MENITVENLRCLIVDDSSTMRQIIKDILAPLKITSPVFAENGKVAYEKLQSNITNKRPQFHVVFLDWAMPEMDGYTLLKLCREDINYNNVAFIMVTAENEKALVMMAIKTGATSFIRKPFTANEFNEKLLKVVNWLEERNVV